MRRIRYDKDGWLPGGVSLVKNNTGEPMFFDHPDTWAAVSDAVKDSRGEQ